MTKQVKTYKTLDSAIEAAKAEHSAHGWYVAVVPIYGKGTFMLQASASSDMVFSIGTEEN